MKNRWPKKSALTEKSIPALVLGLLFFFSLLSLRWIEHIQAINFILFSLFPLFALFVAYRKTSKSSNSTGYTKFDMLFILFLLFAFTSIFWSSNKSFAWSKCINWTLVYLFYRSLNWLELKKSQTSLIRSIFMMAILTCLTYIMVLHFQDKLNIRTLERIHRYLWGNPNYILSNLLLVSIFVSTASFKNFRWNMLRIASISFVVAVILITKSQAVKVLMLLNLVSILIWHYLKWNTGRKYLKETLLLSFLLLIGAIIYQNGLYQEFISEVNGLSDRMAMWRHSFQLCMDHPFQGVGFGNWVNQIYCLGTEPFGPGILSRIFVHAHSIYFETIAELGIPGIVLLIPLLSYPVYAFTKIKKRELTDLGNLLVYLNFLMLCSIYGVVYIQTHLFSLTPFIAMYAAYQIINSSSMQSSIVKENNLILFIIGSSILFWFIYLFYLKVNYNQIRFSKDMTRQDKLEKLLDLKESSLVTHLQSSRQSWAELIIPFHNQKEHKSELIILYEEALRLDPCNAQLILKFSNYLYLQKEFEYALSLNIQKHSLDSRDAFNNLLMAKNYYQLGDRAQADSILQSAQSKLSEFQTKKVLFKQEIFLKKYPDSLFIPDSMVKKSRYEKNLEKSLEEVQNLLGMN